MTTFLLIRHAATDAVDRVLAGRQPGHALNDSGREQVARLCDALGRTPIHRVFSSPLERARQTAVPLADRLKIDLRIAEPLNELDYGDWTGKSFDELALDTRWTAFNTHRSFTRIPGGELMLEVQARAVAFLLKLHEAFPGETIALVTHCDVVRAILLLQRGMSLDQFVRLDVRPASVSVLQFHDDGAVLLATDGAVAASRAADVLAPRRYRTFTL